MPLAETIATVLTVVAVAGYGVAFMGAFSRLRRWAVWPFAAAWAANGAIVVANGIASGHPPLGNMYHVLVFLSLCFFPLYCGLRWRHMSVPLLPYFAFASLFPLIGSFFIERDMAWRRMPALQSPWFMPHVVSYMISYALAAVACALTVVAFCRLWRRKRSGPDAEGLWAAVSDPDVLDEGESRAALSILRLAFPFMTFGLLSGALWAEEAWGVYWSWDPKETWSLITWTLYIVYFHCRYAPTLRRWAVIAQLLAFVALIITFLVVNLLPKLGSILHSYA